ncbi:tRNA pseudouridine synthase A [Candidatus Arsenophonus lipoptenae]|uniref:tRNA pseudouridine synthase A n=1 Tax=Candidatus Arsenophonus lipoptenae TaxID=634113 RepID=A0A109QB63_9GAMM|nr:tRNA pseudouridine(38-40) synthase TruA [Candidatus Arsenophonus lipoptenae]AMA64916.1 tRNA pseudouridine synthase A [Candidatus Arsenophonus lipoptenae]
MIKIALGIEYNGSNYYGWQSQQTVKSIQFCVELALSKVANEFIQVYCSGRTDAGVHAIGQVIHFETSVIRQDSAWIHGVNSNLPSDIVVHWYKLVNSDFHARFSATARRYIYVIFNRKYRSAILASGITHYPKLLDAEKMNIAAQVLVGEHDFTSFRSIKCQSKSPWRHIKHIRVNRYGNYIMIDIKADSFVHHMVRNIVGSLFSIGSGDQDINWIKNLLELKDRTKAAATAKATGLYLISIDYPSKFDLPKTIELPFFLYPFNKIIL